MIFGGPAFGDKPQAGDFGVPAVRFTPAVDFEALAVWLAGDDEHAHARGIALHVFEDLVPGAAVDSANEDVGARLNEPAFEHPPGGGGSIVGDEDGHMGDGCVPPYKAEGGRAPA